MLKGTCWQKNRNEKEREGKEKGAGGATSAHFASCGERASRPSAANGTGRMNLGCLLEMQSYEHP